MTNEPLTLLIDGDPIAYLAASYAGTPGDAAVNAAGKIAKLISELSADRAVVARSDPSRRYFRHQLLAGYKAKSAARPQPRLIDDAWEAIANCRGAIVKQLPGCEADDVVGILATCGSIRGRVLIVADDKDFLTIPGEHYRNRQRVTVLPELAGFKHLWQTLVGDTGDGYPGCPGIGKKFAEDWLTPVMYAQSPLVAWRAVVAAFESKGQTADDAVLQARLARICTAAEYDLVAKRVVLWNPPTADGERHDPSSMAGGASVVDPGFSSDQRGRPRIHREDRSAADGRILDEEQGQGRDVLPGPSDHGHHAQAPAAATEVIPGSLFGDAGERWPS